MGRGVRLAFPGMGDKRVTVGHGAHCVALMIERVIEGTLRSDPAFGLESGVVLTPDEAKALGRRLIQQADASVSA